MNFPGLSLQLLRWISFSGAFLIGVWLPLELCGYLLSPAMILGLDFAVSVVIACHIYLHIKEYELSFFSIKTWKEPAIILDLFCLIPFHALSMTLFGYEAGWMVLLNLPCVLHVRHVKAYLDEFQSLKPITYRLVPIFLMLPVLVHTIACAWIYMGGGTSDLGNDPYYAYIKALYWTITTLTTVGYGDIVPITPGQMLFANAIQLVGMGVFGYILSNVASLLSRADAAREHHMNNLDKVETFMRIHKIPLSLQSRTRAYYHYLWQNKKGYQDDSLIEDLPSKLQSEMFFHINKSIIDKVPFMQDAGRELIEELMDGLEPYIYVPGESIFKMNDEAEAIYLIHAGEVDIVSLGNKKIATLNDGDFFGEMAILHERKRSATAKAKTFCDIYCLPKATFFKVINKHPEFKKHIEKTIQHRLKVA